MRGTLMVVPLQMLVSRYDCTAVGTAVSARQMQNQQIPSLHLLCCAFLIFLLIFRCAQVVEEDLHV